MSASSPSVTSNAARRTSSLVFWLQVATIAVWVVGFALYSMKGAVKTPLMHLDGAFQTASGLYRLDAGQWPGKDFFPYLGIGPLFLLYPFFKLLGANIAASVTSAQFVVLLLWSFYSAFIWRMLWRSKSVVTTIVAGITLLMVATAVCKVLVLPSWGFIPGNSLRAMRMAAPYIAATGYWLIFHHAGSRRTRAAWNGVLVALLSTWSNDYALITIASLGALLLVHTVIRREFRWGDAVAFVVVAVAASAALLMTATQGHMPALARYNFGDVAKDQWWYFGPYIEASRIFDLSTVVRLFSVESVPPLVILIAVGWVLARRRTLELGLLFWVGLVLFLGGSVASVGGHLDHYYGAFYMWGVNVALCAIGLLVARRMRGSATRRTAALPADGRPGPTDVESRTATRASFAMAALAVACLCLWGALYANERRSTSHDDSFFYVERLGGYMPLEWKEYVDLALADSQHKVIEEYWGIWSVLNRSFASWPVDAGIHALGRTRQVARAGLDSADMIVTTRASMMSLWQQWGLSQNYWLYQPILEQFEPLYRSPSTIVWRRMATARPMPEVGCTVADATGDKASIRLDAQAGLRAPSYRDVPAYFEVTLRYRFEGRGRFLLMARNNIEYVIGASGYVSIDPGASTATYPVYLPGADAGPLDVKVVGPGAHTLTLAGCSARRITLQDDDILGRPPSRFELPPEPSR